jgi:outer membrane autotransporter protein
VVPTSTASFVEGSAVFSSAGNAIGRDTALIETGLDVQLCKNTVLGVNYQGQFGSRISQNGVNATLSVKF